MKFLNIKKIIRTHFSREKTHFLINKHTKISRYQNYILFLSANLELRGKMGSMHILVDYIVHVGDGI